MCRAGLRCAPMKTWSDKSHRHKVLFPLWDPLMCYNCNTTPSAEYELACRSQSVSDYIGLALFEFTVLTLSVDASVLKK